MSERNGRSGRAECQSLHVMLEGTSEPAVHGQVRISCSCWTGRLEGSVATWGRTYSQTTEQWERLRNAARLAKASGYIGQLPDAQHAEHRVEDGIDEATSTRALRMLTK